LRRSFGLTTTVPAPTKTEELGRDYADRLILGVISKLGGEARLSDIVDELAETGLDASTIHTLMASSPTRFVYSERKWSAAPGVSVDRTTVATVAARLLDGYGAPMSVRQLAVECASHFGRDSEYFEQVLRRLVKTDPKMFLTGGDQVALAKWLYWDDGETEEAGLFLNELTADDVDSYREVAEGIDWTQSEAPLRFLEAVGKPVAGKVIGYFACKALNPADPYAPELFDVVLASGEYVLGSDGLWYPKAQAKRWLSAAARLAVKIEPTVEIEETAPLELKASDVDAMVEKVLESDQATLAAALLEEMFEVGPAEKSYEEDLQSVIEGLKEREKVMWVGGERFRRPGTEPPYVHDVPEILRCEEPEFRDEDGELIDLELEKEAFSSSLRKEMGHALAQDVLDDEPGPVHKHLSDEVRCVVKPHHKELGTFPLAQIPAGWLPEEPELQEITLEDHKARKLPVWVNHDIRLMFGLADWYYEQEIESGAVFRLTKTTDPSKLRFEWMDEPDPLCYISAQRMEELLDIRERSDEMSTLEILMEVMQRYNKGADFITIMTEINVVRRVTRSLVASILTGYHCFYQRAGAPVWHFDQKKVQQGADKSKRKYARK
jgi:hypothetical protein